MVLYQVVSTSIAPYQSMNRLAPTNNSAMIPAARRGPGGSTPTKHADPDVQAHPVAGAAPRR